MSRESVRDQLEAQVVRAATESLRVTRVGVDVVHIPTWERHVGLVGEPLLRRTYTDNEVEFCEGRIERLAARLAGKEAILKALGTGIRGVGLRDVEIVSESSGRPTAMLHGPAAQHASDVGVAHFEVSLCHEAEYAIAVVGGTQESPR